MPRNSGACVECMKLTTWWTSFRRSPHLRACDRCGGRLVAPGTRLYRIVELDQRATWHAQALIESIRYGYVPGQERTDHWHVLTQAHAAGMYLRYRDLAHDARALYPALRFEFETDQRGQVIA